MKKLFLVFFLFMPLAKGQTPPTDVSVTLINKTYFKLQWTDTSTLESFYIERSLESSEIFTLIGVVLPGNYIFEDRNINLNTPHNLIYGYRIRSQFNNRFSRPTPTVYGVIIINGSRGVGVDYPGLPSTRRCLPYVGYWSINQRKLFKCIAPNTWVLYYRPFTYPRRLPK